MSKLKKCNFHPSKSSDFEPFSSPPVHHAPKINFFGMPLFQVIRPINQLNFYVSWAIFGLQEPELPNVKVEKEHFSPQQIQSFEPFFCPSAPHAPKINFFDMPLFQVIRPVNQLNFYVVGQFLASRNQSYIGSKFLDFFQNLQYFAENRRFLKKKFLVMKVFQIC